MQGATLSSVVSTKKYVETYMLMQNCQIFQGLFGTQQYFSLCQRPTVGSEKHCSIVWHFTSRKEELYHRKRNLSSLTLLRVSRKWWHSLAKISLLKQKDRQDRCKKKKKNLKWSAYFFFHNPTSVNSRWVACFKWYTEKYLSVFSFALFLSSSNLSRIPKALFLSFNSPNSRGLMW